MYRKFPGCSLISVAGISHISQNLACTDRISFPKFFLILREMGIVKIASMRSTDSNPISAQRKPAYFFHSSCCHGNHRIKAGNIFLAKNVTAFVDTGSSKISGRTKGVRIIKGFCSICQISVRYRKYFQIPPYCLITFFQKSIFS